MRGTGSGVAGGGGISDCDFEGRPIFGCKYNESSFDDSNERSDCDSEAIHSKSDGTESSSSISSSQGLLWLVAMVMMMNCPLKIPFN
jgi:hypothetical protein